jgi:CubicO group peptidase (beta-lactamase class C family)
MSAAAMHPSPIRPAYGWLAAALASVGVAHAAPDEELLGKSEGYPVCPLAQSFVQARCIVGAVSRADEMYPSHVVRKGAVVSVLRRAKVEPAEVKALVDSYLEANRTTGLLVLKDDTIVVERYQYDRTPGQRLNSYSMSKTVVAMLVGIAVDEGRIKSLDDRAQDYVPALKGSPYGETPLRNLLTMTSGIRFSTDYGGHDDLALLTKRSLLGGSDGGPATVEPFRYREFAPGERYFYSSADNQVLGLVLRGATGATLSEYLSQKIWKPMGAEADASWLIDKGGYETAFAFLNATLRDWGRLGMVLAHDGRLGERQIIPAAWVIQATTAQAPSTGEYYAYGYQVRVLPGPRRQFALIGQRGQGLFVDPASKLVMVHTAARDVQDADGAQAMWGLWAELSGRLENWSEKP